VTTALHKFVMQLPFGNHNRMRELGKLTYVLQYPINLTATSMVHWECYRNFTNTANLTDVGSEESESVRRSLRTGTVSGSSTYSSASVLLPKDKCIFCNTCRKRKSGQQYEKLSQCMTTNAENTIKQVAQLKNDFQLLGGISGVDLIAKEAMYHKSCYKSYVRGYEDVLSTPSSTGCV